MENLFNDFENLNKLRNTKHVINNRVMKFIDVFSTHDSRISETFKVIANPHHRWNLYVVTEAGNSLPVKQYGKKREFSNLSEVKKFVTELSEKNRETFLNNMLLAA